MGSLIPPSSLWSLSQVEPVLDVNELVSPSAYLLFYIRKDMTSVRFEDVYPQVNLPRFVPNGGENGEDMATMEKFLKSRDAARCVLS